MASAVDALLRHALSVNTRFDEGQRRFLHAGKSCGGLLPALALAFPMLREHGPAHCPRCRAAAAAPAAATGQAAVTSRAAVRARAAMTPSAKRRRKGQFVPVRGGGGAPADVLALASMQAGGRAGQFWCRGATDAAHGTLVDGNVAAYVAGGDASALTDPCARTLIAHIVDTLGWLPVAAQVPVYSPTLRLATAVDLVCTDAVTRRRLYLVEIKATRTQSATPELLDACYKASASRVSPALPDLPMSRYMQHQLQLWAMHRMLTADAGLRVDAAVVLRVGPGFVATYPLNPALLAADAKLANAVIARAKGAARSRRSDSEGGAGAPGI